MINIIFKRTKSGKLRMHITGHAGYAAKGKDIVCAAVTGNCYTLAQAITDYDANGFLARDPVVRMEDGDILLECCPKEEAQAMISHDFYVFARGMQLLASTYGDYISTKFIGEGEQP